MASYVEGILAPDERVALTGSVTNWIWAGPVVLAMVIVAVGLAADQYLHWNLIFAAAVLLATGWVLLVPYIRKATTDLVVTDRRVIVKYGLIRRDTNEMRLSKVESIRIDQGVFERILGYGTVLIRGVGGSFEPITHVADPLAFKRAVEAQLERYETGDARPREG